MNNNLINEDIFECKIYIKDLETNQESKEIDINDLIFNEEEIEFEFGIYGEEEYSTLPYKDFKFFINDYAVTFYSPQYNKATKELNRLNKNYERIYNENCKLREEHNITDVSLLDENYRLNNIINELEEWLEYKINIFSNATDNENLAIAGAFEATLDKLKELKEK